MDARQVRKARYYKRRKQKRLIRELDRWAAGARDSVPTVSEWYLGIEDMLKGYGLVVGVDVFVPRPTVSDNLNRRDRKRFQRRAHYRRQREATGGLYRPQGRELSYRELADEEITKIEGE